MLVDLTPGEEATLRLLIQQYAANGPTVTNATLQAALLANNASWKSAPDVQNVTFTGSSIGFERRGRFSYVVATGATASAVVDSFTNTGTAAFEEFDIVDIAPAAGKQLRMQLPGQPKNVLLSDTEHCARYQLVGGAWSLQSSNPTTAQAWVMPSVRVSTTNNTLAMVGDSVSVRYLTAETPAGGSVTITASGASGTVSAYVDQGYGADLIGTYTYTGTPGNNAVAAGLAADINANFLAGNHLYDATSALAVVTVQPPPGVGSLANTYLLSVAVLGAAAATPLGFGVGNGGTDGVDGVESNGTIEVIQAPATDGAVILLTNEMSANTITLDGPVVAGSNIGATKTIPEWESVSLIYSAAIGKWSPMR